MMILEKYTRTSRRATVYDLDSVIFAEHDSTEVVITIPSDDELGIKDDRAQPTISAFQKGLAPVSFAAGPTVTLLGTQSSSSRNEAPITVVRVGKNGVNTEWAYVSADVQPASSGEKVSVTQFGLAPLALNDSVTDQTSAISSILANASAQGFSLSFPAGRFNYSAKMDNLSCSMYGLRNKTFIHSIEPQGRNTRLDFPSVNGLVIDGLTFKVDNKPAVPSNNGNENDAILRISGKNVSVTHSEFHDPYGVPVLLRSVVGGVIGYCKSIGAYKDSFHITGLSKNISRLYCEVIDGGDDAFAVVGYQSSGTIGRPEGILDIGCIVRGVKYARGFAYVGAKTVRSYGCFVDGFTPVGYSPNNPAAMCGLLIYADGSVNSFGNEDILVDGITVMNCGTGTYTAVQIGAGAGALAKDITLRRPRVINSVRHGIYADGGVSGGIEGLTIEDAIVRDTSDITGFATAPGTGTGMGVFAANVKDLTLIRSKVEESGGHGVNIAASCSGVVKIEVTTSNINKSGAGANDIISIGAGIAATVDIDLRVEAQPQVASAGTPYFIDRIIHASGNQGKIRSMKVENPTNFLKTILLTTPSQTITPTGSPFLWTNTLPYAVMVLVSGGTVVSVARGLTTGIAAPVYNIVNPSKVSGYFTVKPGESLQITYTTAPTLTYIPTQE